MKKRDWLIITLPLIAVWLVDRLTKMWATDLIGYKDYGLIGFVLHHNHGAMLGLFSELPPVLRVVSLSTGGAFLLFTYLIIQYLLPIRSLMLRCGMSMLLGGILGNVTDRIIWNYVVDFLVFRYNRFLSPAMNLADILQWVGYGMIVYALFKEGKILWPEQNNRKSFWINAKYQLKYCSILSLFGFALCTIIGVFSYTYLRVSLESLKKLSKIQIDHLMQPYVITFLIISSAICSVLFLVGLVLSHRSAGPVYAFENFLTDLINGKYRKLKLRQGDEFTHLEEVADQFAEKYKAKLGVVENQNDSELDPENDNEESA